MLQSDTLPPSDSLAWGRLAAVRRSLEWVRLDPSRLRQSPYLGTNCARLLREVDALWADRDSSRDDLTSAMTGFLSLDQLDDGARGPALDELAAQIDRLIPLAQAGATLLAAAPQARLIRPRHEPLETSGGGEPRPRPQVTASPMPSTSPDVDASSPSPSGEVAALDDLGGAPAEAEVPEAPPPPDPEAPSGLSLEELFAQARAPSRKASAPRAPETDEERVLLPFLHPERGEASLDTVAGIPADVVARLAEYGIESVGDLVYLPPVGHDRRPGLTSLESDAGQERMVRGQVLSRCTRLNPGSRRYEVQLDLREHQRVVARWFSGKPRGFDSWGPGAEVALIGVVDTDLDLDTTSPDDAPPLVQIRMVEAEPVGLDGRGSGWLSSYGLEGIEDRELRDAIARSLAMLLGSTRDPLPNSLLESQRLLPLDEALRDAHFPANTTRRGHGRLAFEELFLLQLGIALRSQAGRPVKGIAHKILHGLLGQLELQHKISLDDGQELALSDIRRDLMVPRPMNRLLQGEVGAGKGLVALAAAILVAQGRSQVAMVCPDGHTAERRFLFAEPLLRSLGVNCLLAADGPTHAGLDAIRRGEALIIYGTAGLVTQRVEWKRLGMVVCEERDRYGTLSPSSLAHLNPRPDLLVVTSAPIPASLALTVFGEFDLSIVPPRRVGRAVPKVFAGSEREAAYALLGEQVHRGFQGMVVFPVGRGNDLLGLEDARRFVEAISQELLAGARIAVYSSGMPRDERLRVFDDFVHRRVDVIVSTTYIEDAPPVDNATVMVIEHADKHSLNRLYRLRSHLRHGICALVLGDQPSEEGRVLVQTACDQIDGFHIAELDLQQRGIHEVLGDRATEAPRFSWANPPEDRLLLLRARTEAFQLSRNEPELRRLKSLSAAVQLRWGDWLGEDHKIAPGEDAGAGDKAGGRKRRRRRRR